MLYIFQNMFTFCLQVGLLLPMNESGNIDCQFITANLKIPVPSLVPRHEDSQTVWRFSLQVRNSDVMTQKSNNG
jgi:hypothetical protein